MKDFTHNAYNMYLEAIKASYKTISRFDDFFHINTIPDSFILIRHDVDRRPNKALEMAKLEANNGICSTYYFRTKSHVFKPRVIKEIASMGHEIGYHYESLSDTNGDMERALDNFKYNLEKLRGIVDIKTVAMHGSPFKPFDNRDLWRNEQNKKLLHEKFKILGEVYLDIDYKDIAYVNDTGRNWSQDKSNKRDRVDSDSCIYIKDGNELYRSFKNMIWSKVVFQIHPERWANNIPEYWVQYTKDQCINILKKYL